MNESITETIPKSILLSDDAKEFFEKLPTLSIINKSQSFDRVQMVHLQIEHIMAEIENITQSNAESYRKCSEKEKEISVISKAFDQNIDDLTNLNTIIQEEIDEYKQKIEIQNAIIPKLTIMYQRIVFNRIDLSPYKSLNITYLDRISDVKSRNFQRLMKNRIYEFQNNDRLNYYYIEPFTKQSQYFSDCNTKDQFIGRCIELAKEKKIQIKRMVSTTKDYAQKIKDLKERHDIMHSQMSSEIVNLLHEKEQLIRQIEQIRQMKIEKQKSQKSALSSISPVKSKNRRSVKDCS